MPENPKKSKILENNF